MIDEFAGVKTVDVGDVALAYRERGEGEPVVFVHGSASDLRNWDGQIGPVGVGFRAIAYSRRYARPNQDIAPGIDDQMIPRVADLAAFMQAVGASPAHLVGHSWGGFIALLTAIRHPDAVRSLVLMEPPVISLFVSTPPRPGELLRLFVGHPRTAAAIVTFGATALAPAQKALRRGDEEAGMEAFTRGVVGKAFLERLSEERRRQARETANPPRRSCWAPASRHLAATRSGACVCPRCCWWDRRARPCSAI